LLFHHLIRNDKGRTMREAWRVLRPGGELHIADWGKPQNGVMRAAFLLVQLLDGFETTRDNVNGLLPEFFLEAGFENVRQTGSYLTVFGTLCLYGARKAKSPAPGNHGAGSDPLVRLNDPYGCPRFVETQ